MNQEQQLALMGSHIHHNVPMSSNAVLHQENWNEEAH
jgi:hypothetical protein